MINKLIVAGVFLLAAGCGTSGLSADAGSDFSVTVGEAPEFDGCDSSGDITNYQWVIREAPADMADDVGKSIRESMDDCTFTLEAEMLATEVGSWEIELVVTDTDDNTSSDRVTVDVTE